MLSSLTLLVCLLSTGATPAESTVVSAAEDGHYRVGPGDILKVTVYGYDDLTQVVVVQNDGSFPFPLVGRVAAGGQTVAELQAAMADSLARRFIRNPQVAVVIQEVRSQRVFVMGEVAHPGPFPLSGRTTILELLARAGPLTAAASSEVVIVRPGPTASQASQPTLPASGSEARVIRVNLRALQAGDLSRNVELEANDTVLVSPAPKVYISGEVHNPGAFPHNPGMTVRDLVGLAGGFSEDGSARGLRLSRMVDGRSRERKAKLDDLVEPGDSVVVKAKLF